MDSTWWVDYRGVEPVRSSLVRADAHHWDSVLEDILEENKRQKRYPSTYRHVADELKRDWVNLWRWRRGEAEPTIRDFWGLADVLGIEVQSLFLRGVRRIALATVDLCHGRVTEQEAQLYASYRRVAQQHIDGLDQDALCMALSEAKEVAFKQGGLLIMKVVQALNPALEKACLASLK